MWEGYAITFLYVDAGLLIKIGATLNLQNAPVAVKGLAILTKEGEGLNFLFMVPFSLNFL